MMQLTNAAAQVLKEEWARAGVPPDACLRIQSMPGAARNPAVHLGFAVEPAPTDEMIEHPDLRVFVSADLSDVLADCTLDVKETHEGLELVLR